MIMQQIDKITVQCPACSSDVIYKYGKIKTGKQRFVCVMCGRQFVLDSGRMEIGNRPLCDKCARPMYLYRRGKGFLRFRCSGYPKCRVFKKVMVEEEENDLLYS